MHRVEGLEMEGRRGEVGCGGVSRGYNRVERRQKRSTFCEVVIKTAVRLKIRPVRVEVWAR